MHRRHVPLQRETRVEDAAAKLAGRRAAELAAVLASLMLLERVPALHLLAALVAGITGWRYARLPRAAMARRRRHNPMPHLHVNPQRVPIGQLKAAYVAVEP